jgi:outer membrane biosynthesis protein TonB
MFSTRRFRLSLLAVLALWSLTLLVVEFQQVQAILEEECTLNENGECINPEAEAVAEATEKEEEVAVEEPEVAQATEEGSTDEEETPEPVEEEAVTEEEPAEEEEAAEEEEQVVQEEEPVVEEAPTPAEEEPVAEPKKTETTVTADEEETPNCPSRKHVIKCAGEYLDTNKNSQLERAELQAAIDKLPWWSRGILTILGSVDKMMAKCDIDGDGAIGMGYDMENSKEQCLATCFKRRAFKSAFFPDCEA